MSPTFTAKSRAVPGVAGLMRPPAPISLSGLGVSEQAASASARRRAPEQPNPALRHLDSSILVTFPVARKQPTRSLARVVLTEASFKNVTDAREGETGMASKWQHCRAGFPHNARPGHACGQAARSHKTIRAAP